MAGGLHDLEFFFNLDDSIILKRINADNFALEEG